ncbi:hypothetical protein GCK72_017723 [Caenorhabditis remanei]|uniref:DM domain-containing protein n=2 Tax=Caenorhabditis remanei TaxID=31234 RepID=E3LU69_CAERE|nr:hypothetical protein GCK72_017723 [Caenorhabditis remanei]EFP11031.1 hypothetical protein CRE_31028 [Caenorhabditis remanei]KAF1751169.1 hypothetical protein GCK72_017723 [Caenorhabditis remanei]
MVADVLRQHSQLTPVYRMFPPVPIFSRVPVPTKFKENPKKIYYCQRCLNHDTPRPRKNHKCECPYADCTCDKCGLVEKRRILNIRLQNYNTVENDFDGPSPIDDDGDSKTKGG